MRLSALFVSLVLGLGGLGAPSEAQQLRNAAPPANLPPASFGGDQFVDNRGCVYIRAGRAGAVRWVPRVSRTREQICGLRPTFSAEARPTTRTVRQAAAVPVATVKTRRSTTRNVVVRGKVVRGVTASRTGQLKGPKGANRKIVEARMKIPKGYERAWDDGRLNPLRGVGTDTGKAAMNKVWTQTVPRRLVDPG